MEIIDDVMNQNTIDTLTKNFVTFDLERNDLSEQENKKLTEQLNNYYRTIRNNSEMQDFMSQKYCREFEVESNKHLIFQMDYIPRNIIIIGLGGIGSWVAFYLARIKKIKSLYLIDPDYVETSNISRTPYTIYDVGIRKVEACAKMISDNSPEKFVFPIFNLFNEETINVIKNIHFNSISGGSDESGIMVVDCRDNNFQEYEMAKTAFGDLINWIRVAYDGEFITFDFNPQNTMAAGRPGYETQPSQVFPSSLAGLIAVSLLINFNRKNEKEFKKIQQYPVTFNVTLLLQYIFLGQKLMQQFDGNEDLIRDILVEKDIPFKEKERDCFRKI